MIQLLYSLVFVLCLSVSNAEFDCRISLPCNNTNLNDSKVEDYCESIVHKNMTGRCCISNETVIGLDLRDCGIKKLNISSLHFSELVILDLRDNEFEKFTSEDFVGLLKLEFLYLSSHLPCPGGKAAWNSTSLENNITTCYFQRDPCQYLNISCGEPENAKCQHTGPGSAKCVCCPGHHGYKCLNDGKFPATVFSTSLVIPTVILCIVLWFVQGRDVYRKKTEY